MRLGRLRSCSAVAIVLPRHRRAAHRPRPIPPRGTVDPRVRVVAYNPDDVVKLHGYVGYQIHMQWAEGEEFVNLGAGDTGGFDVGAETNHFFIKPKQESVGTNLTVLTNRRAYHFDYTVSKAPPNAAAARRHGVFDSLRLPAGRSAARSRPKRNGNEPKRGSRKQPATRPTQHGLLVLRQRRRCKPIERL